MTIDTDPNDEAFDQRFKLFHELMARKIREILLVSSPYDAWIMEEDCRLSERIISEYRGLNLSHPPRLTWVSSIDEALSALDKRRFDMVITMPRVAETDARRLGLAVKARRPRLPVILFSHWADPEGARERLPGDPRGIDRAFVWSGNTDILLAVVKSTEDRMNAERDTASAGIRVIIFVEDSPSYISALLPIFYRELVRQTQAVMGEGLNEEHRLLAMRARPKILLAETHEEAVDIYRRYHAHVLGVISDVRFHRDGRMDAAAGVDLLEMIKKDRFDIPLLLTSSDPSNAERAGRIPAQFVDKNSPTLLSEVRAFFLDHLGFGDFVFRMPDGREVARASRLKSLEECLANIPDASLRFHSRRNDFSRWLFARSEIELASKVRPVTENDFKSIESHRNYLISIIHARRRGRQKGVVVNYDPEGFDRETEFLKIGNGSLGGKARGLAFISAFLHRNRRIHRTYPEVNITIPQTLVVTTDAFDAFIENNALKNLSKTGMTDEAVAERFLAARFPRDIADQLEGYLSRIDYPLAVRSSSLLEDAQFRAYAGMYKTYMLSNDHPDLACRLEQLINAVKLVYASTYFREPRAFSRRVGHRTEEEKMAVILQRVVGRRHGGFLYPAISGVAQSRNYYPFAKMRPEDGIATIALGLGKTVVEGEKALRFCPRHPQLLPQFSTVDDMLNNAQQHFYALKMGNPCLLLGTDEEVTLAKREVHDAGDEAPVRLLAGTYLPDEHRIRDTSSAGGFPVITFSPVLKYGRPPLPQLLADILDLGRKGMGCPVEIEFSMDVDPRADTPPEFAVLQVRPMSAREELLKVEILQEEIDRAFCFSSHALGNAVREDVADLVYVGPDRFDPVKTREIAREIGSINAALVREDRKYVLIGPGRWGSADPWLGIPVHWSEICGVAAIVETSHPKLKAEPSQGSHFFHNITTLGINYITVSAGGGDILDWKWLLAQPAAAATAHVTHVRLGSPLSLKVDGRKTRCVILPVGGGAAAAGDR